MAEALVSTVQKPRPGATILCAARRIVTLIFEFYSNPTLTRRARTHTIACLEPEECDGDMQALENLGLAMAHVSSQYPDFAPFVKTINALNRVSRILQEERRSNCS